MSNKGYENKYIIEVDVHFKKPHEIKICYSNGIPKVEELSYLGSLSELNDLIKELSIKYKTTNIKYDADCGSLLFLKEDRKRKGF